MDAETEGFLRDLKNAPKKDQIPIWEKDPEQARQDFIKLQTQGSRFLDNSNAWAAWETTEGVPFFVHYPPSSSIANPGDERWPVLVYLHGGGWVVGGVETHSRLVQDLAEKTGCAVVFVEYTLAPEAHHPEQIEQIIQVIRWLGSEEASQVAMLDASRVILGGDSAGGHLTMMVSRWLHDHRAEEEEEENDFQIQIQMVILLYPVARFDPNFDSLTYRLFAEGPWLTRQAMEWFWQQYLGIEPSDWPALPADVIQDLSPADWSSEILSDCVHRALIVLSDQDVLASEGSDLAQHLLGALVPTNVLDVPGTIHDFLLLNPLSRSAKVQDTLDIIGRLVRQTLALPQ